MKTAKKWFFGSAIFLLATVCVMQINPVFAEGDEDCLCGVEDDGSCTPCTEYTF